MPTTFAHAVCMLPVVRGIHKRPLRILIVVATAALTLTVAGPPAQADYGDENSLVLYYDEFFQGRYPMHYYETVRRLFPGESDEASSLRNFSNVAWIVYDDTGWRDRAYCIPPRHEVPNLGAMHLAFIEPFLGRHRPPHPTVSEFPSGRFARPPGHPGDLFVGPARAGAGGDVLENPPAAFEQGDPAFPEAAQATQELVVGTIVRAEDLVFLRLFDRGLNADARAVVAAVGQGGQQPPSSGQQRRSPTRTDTTPAPPSLTPPPVAEPPDWNYSGIDPS